MNENDQAPIQRQQSYPQCVWCAQFVFENGYNTGTCMGVGTKSCPTKTFAIGLDAACAMGPTGK
jgi:hypothetical protein